MQQTNVIGLGDTIIIDLEASESIMKPVVSIAGHSVTMSGQQIPGVVNLPEEALFVVTAIPEST